MLLMSKDWYCISFQMFLVILDIYLFMEYFYIMCTLFMFLFSQTKTQMSVWPLSFGEGSKLNLPQKFPEYEIM